MSAQIQWGGHYVAVVDGLSKYAHFIKVKHPFSTQNVAPIFVKEVVRLHGFPNSIISYHDKIFISLFWKELFRHTQTDGRSKL